MAVAEHFTAAIVVPTGFEPTELIVQAFGKMVSIYRLKKASPESMLSA